MDELLKRLLDAAGISGHEKDVAQIMQEELSKTCDEVKVDGFGNVIARKGAGKLKIMLAAHMDEIGLLVKHVSKEGFINFIKIGGVDDRILLGQRVIIKASGADVLGVIGAKPPHLTKEEERKRPVKYEDMFIDIGAKSREEVLQKIALADPIIFEPNSGELSGGLFYGKAIDNRLGCFALIRIMERLKADATVYAVGTAQEEVGLKGARTSSFRIDPDYAIAIDTTIAGDMPGVGEKESALKLGQGAAITMIEAAGRGFIITAKMKELLVGTAKRNKIKYQVDVMEGGMTDAATIYMNREGVPCGVLAIPSRYVHSPSGIFDINDIESTVTLVVESVKELARQSA